MLETFQQREQTISPAQVNTNTESSVGRALQSENGFRRVAHAVPAEGKLG